MQTHHLNILLVTITIACGVSAVLSGYLLPSHLLLLKLLLIAFFITIGIFCIKIALSRYHKRQLGILQNPKHKEDIAIIQQYFDAFVLDNGGKIETYKNSIEQSRYNIPWYILIGGNTQDNGILLKQNDYYPFAIPKKSSDPSRNILTFWHNDDAVIIEIGQHLYQSALDNSPLWRALIDKLLRYRPLQAINGVILTVQSSELIRSETEASKNLYDKLKYCLLDLSKQIKISFPVYPIFTRADRLHDFVKFFDYYNKSSSLDGPLGITLPIQQSHLFDEDIFNQHCSKLISSITDQQISQLHGAEVNGAEVNSAIISFPYQLAILLDQTRTFLAKLNSKNYYRNQRLWIRGAYFVAVDQNNPDIDLLTKLFFDHNKSDNLDHTSQVIAATTPSPKLEQRSFFSQQLLKKVILPESRLASFNSGKIRNFLISYTAIGATLFLIFCLTSFTLINNWFFENKSRNLITSGLQKYQQQINPLVNESNWSQVTILDITTTLSNLRDSIQISPELLWHQQVSFQQDKIRRVLQKEYQHQLSLFLMPKLAELLTQNLAFQLHRHDIDKTFDALGYYNMLFDYKHLNKADLIGYVTRLLKEQNNNIPDNSIEQLSLLLGDLLQNLYQHKLTIDPSLVEKAKITLRNMPPQRSILAQLKASPKYGQQVNIKDSFGPFFFEVFQFKRGYYGYIMPRMFTSKGFNNIDLTVNSPLLQQQLKKFRLIQNQAEEFSVNELETISNEVTTIYLEEYMYRWSELVANIEIKNFSNSEELLNALEKLRSTMSPLQKIIQTISRNTLVLEKTYPNLDQFFMYQQFHNYQSLLNGNTKLYINLDQLVARLNSLYIQLYDSLSSYNVGEKLFQHAKQHRLAMSTLMNHLDFEEHLLPARAYQWITSIQKQLWQNILTHSYKYINAAWQNDVYKAYTNYVAGQFPFNPNTDYEISKLQFSDMFHPKTGKINRFIDQYLAPFIEWNSDIVKLRKIHGEILPIKATTLKRLETARIISQSFFDHKGQQRFTLRLKLNHLSKNLTRFVIHRDHPIYNYRKGYNNFWTTVKWPDNNNKDLFLGLYDNDLMLFNKKFSGEWALLRLLFDGKVIRQSNSNLLQFNLEGWQAELKYSLLNDNKLQLNFIQKFSLPSRL